MKRSIVEWTWRVAMLGALLWVGWELHRFHDDMLQPVEQEPTLTADTEEVLRGIDDVRDDVADLNDKVDAVIVALARTR